MQKRFSPVQLRLLLLSLSVVSQIKAPKKATIYTKIVLVSDTASVFPVSSLDCGQFQLS